MEAVMDWICLIDPWKTLTAITAVFAGWIAWNQYHINNEKLRLDLFEKRFVVFKATQVLLSKVLRDAAIEYSDIFEYRAGKSEAVFFV